VVLPNRIVVTPGGRGLVEDDGADRHLVELGSRALGGAGLVLTRPAGVSRAGGAGAGEAEQVAAWKRIVDFVHASSGARIGLQLAHALSRGAAPPDPDALREDFARAAELAAAAGFDLLLLHPLGGRPRLEIFDAVRAVWPAGRPIAVRVPAPDGTGDGLAPAEAVGLARALGARGCDLVDVSAGGQEAGAGAIETACSDRIRHEAGIPTMTAGGVAHADVNSILAAGRADLCLLAPAHRWDPAWPLRAAREQGVEATLRPAGPGSG
jgi:anthraniloyl-CoA monooxygenase